MPLAIRRDRRHPGAYLWIGCFKATFNTDKQVRTIPPLARIPVSVALVRRAGSVCHGKIFSDLKAAVRLVDWRRGNHPALVARHLFEGKAWAVS